MAYSEFVSWCKYRSKYGSLHGGMRIDRAVARAIAYYFSANSKKSFDPADFSPFDQVDKEDKSIDEVFGLLAQASHGK